MLAQYKNDNLQYVVGGWNDGMIVWPTDGPMETIAENWDSKATSRLIYRLNFVRLYEKGHNSSNRWHLLSQFSATVFRDYGLDHIFLGINLFCFSR